MFSEGSRCENMKTQAVASAAAAVVVAGVGLVTAGNEWFNSKPHAANTHIQRFGSIRTSPHPPVHRQIRLDRTAGRHGMADAMEPPATAGSAEKLEADLRDNLKSAVAEAADARKALHAARGKVTHIRSQLGQQSWQELCEEFGPAPQVTERTAGPDTDEQSGTDTLAEKRPAAVMDTRRHARVQFAKWVLRVRTKRRKRAPPGMCKACFAETNKRRHNRAHTRESGCRLDGKAPPKRRAEARGEATADSG